MVPCAKVKDCALAGLKRTLSAAGAIWDRDACGAGFKIRRNHMHGNRRYGCLLRAGDGVVEDNLFEDTTAFSLALAHFRKMHHDVVVFHVLDPKEIDFNFKKGAQFEDMETMETIVADPRALAEDYQKVFGEFLERNRKACASLKASTHAPACGISE